MNPDWDGAMKSRAREPQTTLSGIPRVEGVPPESAREDIANALAIIVAISGAGYPLVPFDVAAIRKRLESALSKLGSIP